MNSKKVAVFGRGEQSNSSSIALFGIALSLCIGAVASFCNINIWNELDLDEFYNALCVRDYSNSPLGLLSFYEGHLFLSIFGDKLINLRILSQANIFVTVLIGVWYYWRQTRDYQMTSILLCVCSISAPICFVMVYDWNTASFPFMILSLIGLLEYTNGSKSKKTIVLLGVVQALTIQTRLPLVFMVPITIVVFFLDDSTKRVALQRSFLYILVVVLSTLLLYLLILGSPTNWLSMWSPDNIISGHGNLMVYIKNLSYARQCLPQASPLLIALLLSPYIQRLEKVRSRRIAFSMAAIFLIGYDLIAWGRGMDSPVNGYYYFAAIALFIVAYYINIKDREKIIAITVIAAFALLPAIGSDVMVFRPIWLFVLPMLLLYLVDLRKTLKTWLLLSGCVLVVSFGVTAYRIHSRSSAQLGVAKISEMKQTPDHAAWVAELIDDVQQTVPNVDDMIVVGQGKYLIDYLLTDGVGYHNNFFHYMNFDRTEGVDDKMFSYMSTKGYVILAAPKWETIKCYRKNHVAIKSAGFEEVLSKPSYIIYKRAE